MFSLIMGTLGRDQEIQDFISSLIKQTYDEFELIIVDQNQDDRVDKVLAKMQPNINIQHIKTSEKGLSKARNIGLTYAQGKFIAFPDDDCLYPENLLEMVKEKLDNPNLDGLTCISKDNNNKPSNTKWAKSSRRVNSYNLFKCAISYTIFLKSTCTRGITFNEQLGVGAPFGSTEESDYLLNVIKKGETIQYFPEMYVIHPDKPNTDIERISHYAPGQGAFYKIHLFADMDMGICFNFVVDMIAKPIIGLTLGLLGFMGLKKRWIISSSLWKGFIKYKR
jgi:glycosyltransferase involved in cell wall biosynthesis